MHEMQARLLDLLTERERLLYARQSRTITKEDYAARRDASTAAISAYRDEMTAAGVAPEVPEADLMAEWEQRRGAFLAPGSDAKLRRYAVVEALDWFHPGALNEWFRARGIVR
jgi:hypothetical protein